MLEKLEALHHEAHEALDGVNDSDSPARLGKQVSRQEGRHHRDHAQRRRRCPKRNAPISASAPTRSR